jgi:predicted SpoU family rRNA methylase
VKHDPTRKRRLAEAVQLALRGDWQAAHSIVQEHEDDPVASWIHAVVHRMEGDLGNANYWYRRCRRELREDVTTEAELREIEKMLV